MHSEDFKLVICIMMSLAWHVFCIWLIKPVLISKEFEALHFSNISFLGAILTEASLELCPVDESREVSYSYHEAAICRFLNIPAGLYLKRTLAPPRSDEKNLQAALAQEAKVSPQGIFAAVEAKRTGKEICIDGPAGRRVFVYRPEAPRYPGWWLKDVKYSFDMRLKFWVTPEGKVRSVRVLTSSGYPEVDLIGARYLREWLFETLSDEMPQRNMWGTVELKFKYR